MKIFGKFFGNSDSVETVIAESKKQINQNPTGHLPLSYRVRLNRQIADEIIINKIYLECSKKANVEEDSIISEMLHKATAFLYQQQGDKKFFEQFADNNRNHFESNNDIYGLAGCTACWFAYSIAYGAEIEDYNGTDDDNMYDWQDWTPDFYASMTISGGNPFVGKGDIRKRREFWNWYLQIVETLIKSSEKPILPLKEVITLPKTANIENLRTQTANKESVSEKLGTVVKIAFELIEKQKDIPQWNRMEIENCYFYSRSAIINFSGQDNTKYKIDQVENYSSFSTIMGILSEIRKEMYQQNPIEGAWFVCAVTIKPDTSYNISFNYDDNDNFPTWRKPSIDDFSREFENFPRNKEFTPEWLQDVVKRKKLKYLEL